MISKALTPPFRGVTCFNTVFTGVGLHTATCAKRKPHQDKRRPLVNENRLSSRGALGHVTIRQNKNGLQNKRFGQEKYYF